MGWENFRLPGGPNHNVGGGIIASAATIAPQGAITRVSGTTEITLITLPYEGFEGVLWLIPTGAFTGATGGVASGLSKAIGKAFTAIASVAFPIVYCKETGLWYPVAQTAELID
jgi:hypothetical protein